MGNVLDRSQERQISRFLQCPDLNDKEIEFISNLCFGVSDTLVLGPEGIEKTAFSKPLTQNLSKGLYEGREYKNIDVDVLFEFSDSQITHQSAENIVRFLEHNPSTHYVLIAGGRPNFKGTTDDSVLSESARIMHLLEDEYEVKKRFPSVSFVLEENSQNGAENVKFGLEKLKDLGLDLDSIKIGFVKRGQMFAGRFMRTLNAYGISREHIKMIVGENVPMTVSDEFRNQTRVVFKDNWYKDGDDLSKGTVWGEFARHILYSLPRNVSKNSAIHDFRSRISTILSSEISDEVVVDGDNLIVPTDMDDRYREVLNTVFSQSFAKQEISVNLTEEEKNQMKAILLKYRIYLEKTDNNNLPLSTRDIDLFLSS